MSVFITVNETQMYDQKRDENLKMIHFEPFKSHFSGSCLLLSNQQIHIIIHFKKLFIKPILN